jgi:predicted phosphohydrolase
MIRVAWATDVHLEFLDEAGRGTFYDQLLNAAPDFVVLSGDIGTANNVEGFLAPLDRFLACPVLFVLGNHDFYNGSIDDVRARVTRLAAQSNHLTYLTRAGIVALSSAVCVVGHDGWGDARFGDFAQSRLFLNDFRLIRELALLPRPLLRHKLQQLGDEAAAHFDRFLPEALKTYQHVLVVTHVPPFRELCVHDGRPADDEACRSSPAKQPATRSWRRRGRTRIAG